MRFLDVLVAVAFFITPGQAAEPPDPVCEPPTQAGDVIIDLQSADVHGRTEYKMHESVRAVVIGKNPFRYDYRVRIEEIVLEETAAGFLQDMHILPKPSGGPPPSASDTPQPAIVEECGLVPAWNEFASARETVEKAASTIMARLSAVWGSSAAQNLQTIINQLYNEATLCVRLKELARGLQDAVAAANVAAPTYAQEANLRDLESKLTALQSAHNAYASAEGATDACIQRVKDQTVAATALAAEARTRLKEKLDDVAALERATQDIDRVLRDPTAFSQAFVVGHYDVPHRTRVSIERRDRQDAKATFASVRSVEFKFSGPTRFVVAGGVAFSFLDFQRFQRVQGLPRTATGEPIVGAMVQPVIDYTENSKERVLPLLLVHARVYRQSYASLGTSAKNTDDGARLEYLLGVSWATSDQQFIVTGGGYYGVQERLPGGLYVGMAVPNELADIPARLRREWSVGISLSYKLR